jgi:hypothetical protein
MFRLVVFATCCVVLGLCIWHRPTPKAEHFTCRMVVHGVAVTGPREALSSVGFVPATNQGWACAPIAVSPYTWYGFMDEEKQKQLSAVANDSVATLKIKVVGVDRTVIAVEKIQ